MAVATISLDDFRAVDMRVGRVVEVVSFPARQIGPMRSGVLVLGAVQEDGTVPVLRPDGDATPGQRIA